MTAALRKFATQADPRVLEEVRAIAAREGKQLQAVIDEALRDFIDKRKRGKPRPEVLTALGESLAEYDALYRALAK
ncbi:MAG: hypothetical protein FIB05_14625 [Betaproteobacteria bacterium]|nr:hypothetical protein [Betaproteobacteria bacterium]PWB57901.1 MAG: hypothetical protein C3F16_14560 [Betaproteobacteria bacterium]